jgi:outer membrane protein assembly factor BamB
MRCLSCCLVLAVSLTSCGLAECGDWPWWRGPYRTGTAEPQENVPTTWSVDENIAWMTPIPGRGHGSPTIVGDRVFVAIAERDRASRSVVCLDRRSGEELWTRDVHVGNETPYINDKGSDASSTIACDGERVYVNFLHDGAMVTSALSLDGEILWQRAVTDYIVHQAFASSPAVYGELVLVTADTKAGGVVAALDRESGEIVWSHDRPELPNYVSPIVLDVADRAQLLLMGCDLVTGFDPQSGEKLWEVAGSTTECVTSTVVHGDLMFTSGGYPENHLSAVRCDGSGELVWKNDTRVYVPSFVIKDGYLYAVADAGVAICWNAETGEEVWMERLGGTFSSSCVLAGDMVFATEESSKTTIFRASPDAFELIAENQLGDECFATPAICGNHIYNRIAINNGDVRQEYVVSIGERESQ